MGRFRLIRGKPALGLPTTIMRKVSLTRESILGRTKDTLIRVASGDYTLDQIKTDIITNPYSVLPTGGIFSSAIFDKTGLSTHRDTTPYKTQYGAETTDYILIVPEEFNEDKGKYFLDYSAIVSISRKKNVVVTPVQGRNGSRKEYVSSGDDIITIKGRVTSKFPNLYPREELNKLIVSLDSTDIIDIRSPFLNYWGIYGMIILDYSLPQRSGFHNTQDYVIRAIAEKPVDLYSAMVLEKEKEEKSLLAKVNEWVNIPSVFL